MEPGEEDQFTGTLQSPLTDSNRRPPPYHGGSGAVLAVTAGHSRSRFPAHWPFALCLECTRVPARARVAVPVSYPRCVVCLKNEQRASSDRVLAGSAAAGFVTVWAEQRPPPSRIRNERGGTGASQAAFPRSGGGGLRSEEDGQARRDGREEQFVASRLTPTARPRSGRARARTAERPPATARRFCACRHRNPRIQRCGLGCPPAAGR